MAAEVIFPYAGSDPYRQRALTWASAHCEAAGFSSTVATSKLPFNKATTLLPAIQRSQAEIVVVHDADVWAPGLVGAVQAVQDGAPWAIPHWKVHRLSEAATSAVLLGGANWESQPCARPPYVGMAGGGVLVALRDTLLDIPPDPRFAGWGQEDESWAMALWCLLGAPWRGQEPLIHAWHPPAVRRGQRVGSRASWLLRNRYAKVRHDPAGMRQLLGEALDAAFVQPA
jgi:hypothetical protein